MKIFRSCDYRDYQMIAADLEDKEQYYDPLDQFGGDKRR